LRQADWKGSSRQSLVKYLMETHGMAKEEASAVVSEGVREGTAAGTVIQTRQSFTAKGHTFAKPADITLGIEELVPPSDPASKAAKAGDVVDVAYVGKHPDGAVFEESTLVFVLGAGDVIKAWDEGIVGMRVGQQARTPLQRAAQRPSVALPLWALRQYAALFFGRCG